MKVNMLEWVSSVSRQKPWNFHFDTCLFSLIEDANTTCRRVLNRYYTSTQIYYIMGITYELVLKKYFDETMLTLLIKFTSHCYL
jgi:hypothetical protein